MKKMPPEVQKRLMDAMKKRKNRNHIIHMVKVQV